MTTTSDKDSGAATSPPADKPAILAVQDLHAPEFFASKLTGAGFDGNGAVIRMTFASNRTHFPIDGAPQLHQVENVRIVMTTASAAGMASFL